MHDLADSPAAFTVGCVDFGRVEMAERLAEKLRHLSKGVDGFAAVFRRDRGGRSEGADGITRVGKRDWRSPGVSDGRQFRQSGRAPLCGLDGEV
jgi:hypothetical protein